jgi:hypothetical protein
VGKVIPSLIALLPDKEKAAYLCVADKVLILEGNSEVQTIMMDYEKGMVHLQGHHHFGLCSVHLF